MSEQAVRSLFPTRPSELGHGFGSARGDIYIDVVGGPPPQTVVRTERGAADQEDVSPEEHNEGAQRFALRS